VAIGIYGGILRFARGWGNQCPMLEDANRFSGKIMFKQRDEASFSFNLMKS